MTALLGQEVFARLTPPLQRGFWTAGWRSRLRGFDFAQPTARPPVPDLFLIPRSRSEVEGSEVEGSEVEGSEIDFPLHLAGAPGTTAQASALLRIRSKTSEGMRPAAATSARTTLA